jgi:hypothetical protein
VENRSNDSTRCKTMSPISCSISNRSIARNPFQLHHHHRRVHMSVFASIVPLATRVCIPWPHRPGMRSSSIWAPAAV